MTKNQTGNESRTALLAGATGLVGGRLLQLLLEDPVYQSVITIGRHSTGKQHPKLKELITNFSELDFLREIPAVDDVYCALGTTIKTAGSQKKFSEVDHDYVIELGKLAVKAGAQRFLVVSALGADKNSAVFYNRVKGEMERDIARLSIPAIHIFRPSLLLGDRKEFRLGEKIATAAVPFFSLLLIGPLGKYKPVQAALVARAMVAMAKSGATGILVHENEAILE